MIVDQYSRWYAWYLIQCGQYIRRIVQYNRHDVFVPTQHCSSILSGRPAYHKDHYYSIWTEKLVVKDSPLFQVLHTLKT